MIKPLAQPKANLFSSRVSTTSPLGVDNQTYKSHRAWHKISPREDCNTTLEKIQDKFTIK